MIAKDEVTELRIAIGRLISRWQQRQLEDSEELRRACGAERPRALWDLDRVLELCDRFAQRERVRVLADHVRELKELITPPAPDSRQAALPFEQPESSARRN